jgi:hypothetical protein
MLSAQEMLDLVCWNRRSVVVPEVIDAPERGRSVFLFDPTSTDRLAALQAKRRCQQECEANGVPTEEELFEAAKAAGIWTEHDDLVRKEGKEHIQFLEKKIREEKLLSRKRSYQKQIDDTYEQLRETDKKHQSIYVNTLEYLVRETELLTLVYRVTRTEDEEPLWRSESELLQARSKYGQYVVYLMHRHAEELDLSVAEYRRLARSGDWRLFWTLSKENLSDLFGRPIQDISSRQKLLIYWSRVYDSVFDDHERPDEEIIDDDDRLDEWLANRATKQDEKRQGEKVAGKPSGKVAEHNERVGFLDGYHVEDCVCGALQKRGKGLGESPRHDAGCAWGTWRAYTAEEKEELGNQFYGRNSKQVRHLLDSEQDAIVKHGELEEQHLRKKRSRELLGQQSKVIPINRR